QQTSTPASPSQPAPAQSSLPPNPVNSNTPVSNSTASNSTASNSTTPSSNATSTSSPSSAFSSLPPPGAEPVYITITAPKPQDTLKAIGRAITFSWSYSSNFAVAPKYLNICAVPQTWLNNPNYQNYSIVDLLDPSTTTYTWNTSKITNPELIESKYILFIYDERGWQPQNTGGAGRLQASSTFSFSLYKPGSYVPLSDYHCAECSAASTSLPPLILMTATPIIIFIVSHFYFSID
ncbi:11978_t:CDS:2, partial [Racocetra persica]